MDRRRGVESVFGVGGGMISKEAQKNLDRAEDLCRRKKPEKALPFLVKALEDPNNLDAAVQMAFLMPNLDLSLNVLENAEQKGRMHLVRMFGTKAFDDDGDQVGHFWGIIETRPYMRVLQAIVRIAFEKKDYAKSANTIIEMLRLCPGDNMGQRDWLGSVLLKAGRYADALFFIQEWMDPETMKTGAPPPLGGCAFDLPSRSPLTAKQLEDAKWFSAEMAYTGALATFKMWGDTELARQYLRMGSRANPHVLLKILAKIDQPRNLNMMPRSLNGPEMAHDYLWLTQDLWMEPTVWAWANGDAEAKGFVLKTCSREACGRREESVAQFKRCGACKEALYCSKECQRADWKTHKPDCQRHKKMKEMTRAMALGKPVPDPKAGYPLAAAADFTPNGIATTFYNQ